MKRKKRFLTLLMAGVVAMFFCLSGTVFAKGPNPPTVGANEKLIGPNVQGTVVLGWRETQPGYGSVEAYLWLKDKFYATIWAEDMPEGDPEDPGDDGFLNTTEFSIPRELPTKIAEDYNMGLSARAVIFEEKDVSEFHLVGNIQTTGGALGTVAYKHMLYFRAKISFIVPKK